MKIINVVAAIIKKENKVFIAERGYGEFKGMYEFPGGKIEDGENKEEAIKREIYEEMQARIEVDSFFYHVHHEYDSFILEMDCYICHLLDDHFVLLEHLDGKWIDVNHIPEDIVWVPADIKVIEELQSKGV